MLIHLSPVNPATDYPRLAELLRATDPEPVALRRLRQWRSGAAGRIHLQVAAYDGGGRIVGFAEVIHEPATAEPGYFQLNVTVDPARQRQGIGEMLYDDALEFAREQGARALVTEVSDMAPESVRFARQRGFHLEAHICDAAASDGPFEGYYATTVVVAGYYVMVKQL
ncbi:MAG: GNAT family N-acetyltransferase [Ktedonobacterales bacterium]